MNPATMATPISPQEIIHMIKRGDVQGVTDALCKEPSLVYARTLDGDTPLHIACWQKQIGIIGTILAFQPDLNARGCYGRTPLHYAVQEGSTISIPIVGVLLIHGADPSIRDDNGHSVEDLAKLDMYDGLAEVLNLLRQSSGKQQP